MQGTWTKQLDSKARVRGAPRQPDAVDAGGSKTPTQKTEGRIKVSDSIGRMKDLVAEGYQVQNVVSKRTALPGISQTICIGLAVLRKPQDLLDEVPVELWDEADLIYAETEKHKYLGV